MRMDEALVAKLELMTKQFVVLKPIEVRLDNLLIFDLVFTLNILLFTLFLSIFLSLPPFPPFIILFRCSFGFTSLSSTSRIPLPLLHRLLLLTGRGWLALLATSSCS